MQLAEEKVREIDALKEMQVEMQHKATEEITELKKVQDGLIVEKEDMCSRCGEVEQAVSKSCQHIFKNMIELTPGVRAK